MRYQKKKVIIKTSFFIGALLGIFIWIVITFGYLFKNYFYKTPLNSSSQSLVASSHSISPTPLPTPSLTPTPTQSLNLAKPAGYCLDVPVLLYHHIEPYAQAKAEGHVSLTVDNGWFDKQMAYISQRGYTTISADQLAGALIHHQGLGKSIVVTLDDGYQDVYTYAYPIAQKYHMILNLMIPSGLINNPGYMNWEELKQMSSSGLAFAYDHTWSHAALANAPMDKVRFEIMTSKTQLEQNLGRPVNIFTYPYGNEGQRVIDFLTANGFVAAFSTIPGFWQCDSFIMSLHRNRIGNAPLSYYGL